MILSQISGHLEEKQISMKINFKFIFFFETKVNFRYLPHAKKSTYLDLFICIDVRKQMGLVQNYSCLSLSNLTYQFLHIKWNKHLMVIISYLIPVIYLKIIFIFSFILLFLIFILVLIEFHSNLEKLFFISLFWRHPKNSLYHFLVLNLLLLFS